MNLKHSIAHLEIPAHFRKRIPRGFCSSSPHTSRDFYDVSGRSPYEEQMKRSSSREIVGSL
jgi:hypothetical protein